MERIGVEMFWTILFEDNGWCSISLYPKFIKRMKIFYTLETAGVSLVTAPQHATIFRGFETRKNTEEENNQRVKIHEVTECRTSA